MHGLNSTNGSVHPRFPKPERSLAFLVIGEILCAVGVIQVVLLVAVILTNRTLRQGSGFLIANLQLVHLFFCGILMPVSIWTNYSTNYVIKASPLNCIAITFSTVTFLITDAWISLSLAVNRLVALIFPREYSRLASKAVMALMVALSWVIGFLCQLFPFLDRNDHSDFPVGNCEFAYYKSDLHMALMTIIGGYIPLTLEAGIYITVFVKVCGCAVRSKPGSALEHAGIRKSKRRLVLFRILASCYAWYVFCYVPIPVVVSLYPMLWIQQAPVALFAVAMSICGMAFNPVFYFAQSGDYRNGLLLLLRRCAGRLSVVAVVSETISHKHPSGSRPRASDRTTADK